MKHYILILALAILTSPSVGATQSIPVAQVNTGKTLGTPIQNLGSQIDPSKIRLNEEAVSVRLLDSALRLSARRDSAAPADLDDLTGGFHMFQHQMSMDAALKLNLVAFSSKFEGAQRVFVHDFVFYKDMRDSNSLPVRYGAGVRLVIQAKQMHANANFNNLPAIAASAEFGFAETNVDFRTIGISGPRIDSLVPKAAAYDVETHVSYMQAIDRVIAAARDSTTTVTPEIITVNPQEDAFYIDVLVRAHAMRQILMSKSCEDARKSLAKSKIPRAEQAVNAAYTDLTGRCDKSKPTDAVMLATLNRMFGHAGVLP